MKVKDISLKKGMTVKVGSNYTRIEVGMTAEPDEGETQEQALEQVTAFINQKLVQEVEAILPKRQTLMEQATAKSLPHKPRGIEEMTV